MQSRDSDVISRDYLVTPSVGRGPGVLLLHSELGFTPFVKQLTHQFAHSGFVTLSADLFDGQVPSSREEARRIKDETDDMDLLRRLEDAVSFLLQHEKTSRREIGVIGFGYGAELAGSLATSIPEDIGGVVFFYGLRESNWETFSIPVLGHYAQLDHDLPPSRIRDLRDSLRHADVDADLFIYQNTEPAFLETDDDRHDPEAARLALERTEAFLRNELMNR